MGSIIYSSRLLELNPVPLFIVAKVRQVRNYFALYHLSSVVEKKRCKLL